MSVTSVLAVADQMLEVLRIETGATRKISLMITALDKRQNTSINLYQLSLANRIASSAILDNAGAGYTQLPSLRTSSIEGKPEVGLKLMMVANSVSIVSSGIYYATGQILSAAGVSLRVNAVDRNGRVQSLSFSNAPLQSTITPTLIQPSGGGGRDLAVLLSYRVGSIDVITPSAVSSDSIEVIGNGSGAAAHLVADYVIQPQHEMLTATLGPNEYTIIKDLPLSGDDVLLLKPSRDVAVRIIDG